MLKKIFYIVVIFFISCSSGGDDSVTPTPNPIDVIPTNLSLAINIVGSDSNHPYGDGTGVVQFTATATNAVKYGFKFGNEAEQESTSGSIQKTYAIEGINTYEITVFAYSTTNNSVNIERTVTVSFYNGSAPVWADEFHMDGAVDASKWHHQIQIPAGGSWFNGEQQHYTNRLDNSYVDNGTLKIVAKKETFSNQGYTKEYTSARLNSKFAFTYGRVDIRAKLPSKAGTWPALWMLGKNIDEDGGYWDSSYGNTNWPVCGEIDIMEQTGWDKSKVLGTCHWYSNGNASYGLDKIVSNASTQFHVYSMEWTTTYIKLFVDNQQFYEIALNASLPFDQDFYFLFNIAMGGTLGGTIDPGFIQDTMEVDYIRVYQ